MLRRKTVETIVYIYDSMISYRGFSISVLKKRLPFLNLKPDTEIRRLLFIMRDEFGAAEFEKGGTFEIKQSPVLDCLRKVKDTI